MHDLRRTRIKFCGLTRVEDLAEACALGVDAIGLVFYPRSPRALDDAQAAALRRRLPSFVTAVGLFVDAAPEADTLCGESQRTDVAGAVKFIGLTEDIIEMMESSRADESQ